MSLLTCHRSALVAMCVALAGCAGTSHPRDAGVLSSQKSDKLAPGATASKESKAQQPALELDTAIVQAQAQRISGDLTQAMQTLSQLVLVAPDDPRVLGEYGKTLVAKGRSDDALAFLERAIQLQPADWTLFSAQGVAFDQKGQYRQAQDSYARALAFNPSEPTVLSNSALSHMQSGDLEKAERLLLEAAQAGGNFPRISSNLALVQRLKASRSADVHDSAKTVVQAPAPISAPPSEPEPAPAIVSVPDTDIAVPQPEAVPEPMTQPVQRAALPDAENEPPMSAMPLRPASAEELASDPTVRMQAVPKDEHAGPVVLRKRVAETRVAAKQTKEKAAAPKPAEEASDSFLRPTLDTAATEADQ